MKVEEVGATNFLIDEQVDPFRFQEENDRVTMAGPSIGRPLLLGTTKASLSTDSFISAATFQETTRSSPKRRSPARSTTSTVSRKTSSSAASSRLAPASRCTTTSTWESEIPETAIVTDDEVYLQFNDEEIRALPPERERSELAE